MLGNLQGWLISVVIVVTTVGVLQFVDGRIRPTPPDGFGADRANAAPLVLPVEPLGRVSKVGEESVAALYLRAIESCDSKPDPHRTFARQGSFGEIETVRAALDLLDRAAALPTGPVFASTPATLINYDNIHPPLQTLELLGRVALRAGQVGRSTDRALAERWMRAAFMLGYNLFAERLTYEQLDTGLRLMAESAAVMKQGEREHAASPSPGALDAFDAARLALARNRVLPIAGRIRTLDPTVVAANAGNVREWAKRSDTDRVWRVEAILALGRQRYFVGHGVTVGDERAARRLLEVLAENHDPVIAHTARTALSLAPEQFRMLR